jgi:hypothetical protein
LCAIIHRLRPRLIPYSDLKGGKEGAINNLTLALDHGETYCNVPKILLPTDISSLDEISMMVYLFDWYYGVATLMRQDVAARRIGKLINMTRLHDKMRSDYTSAAQATMTWVAAKCAWLNSIKFNNTLLGIRLQQADLHSYKSGEKAQEVAKNLDNDALFNNLAVRLRAASRPPFTPQGLLPR